MTTPLLSRNGTGPTDSVNYSSKDTCYLSMIFCLSSVKKKIGDFWDLNQGPKSCLQSLRHSTTTPLPPQDAIHIIYHLTAGALCELPRLFGGNSHSDAACNFCPGQLGCVRLPRPVRVHWLPRKLGLHMAAPIARVECGRGVG